MDRLIDRISPALPLPRQLHAPSDMREVSPPAARGFVVAVDLGQSVDYTAISVIERSVSKVAAFKATMIHPEGERVTHPERRIHHNIRLLERPALGTAYPAIGAACRGHSAIAAGKTREAGAGG